MAQTLIYAHPNAFESKLYPPTPYFTEQDLLDHFNAISEIESGNNEE